MSKSILVIDTPENCYNCEIRQGYACRGVSGTFGMGKDIDDFRMYKPDWCPLKDTPEKKEITGREFFSEKALLDGYNACVDEILKNVFDNPTPHEGNDIENRD